MHGLKEIVWMNQEAQIFWENGKTQSPTLQVTEIQHTKKEEQNEKSIFNSVGDRIVGGSRTC